MNSASLTKPPLLRSTYLVVIVAEIQLVVVTFYQLLSLSLRLTANYSHAPNNHVVVRSWKHGERVHGHT